MEDLKLSNSIPGVSFSGPITINGPMFDIHDNQHIHFNVTKDFYERHSEAEPSEVPTKDQMIQAIKATVKQGMWWSSRSWAVVYRVYQMKGYVRNYTSFVNEVKRWHVETGFECTYDAIQKPIACGMYVGNPEKWENNGASKQAVKFAFALLEDLESLMKNTKEQAPPF